MVESLAEVLFEEYKKEFPAFSWDVPISDNRINLETAREQAERGSSGVMESMIAVVLTKTPIDKITPELISTITSTRLQGYNIQIEKLKLYVAQLLLHPTTLPSTNGHSKEINL